MKLTQGLALTVLAAPLCGQAYDFAAAKRYSDQRNGHALLAMIDGKTVYEQYTSWQPSTPHRLASGTKSFSGVIAAFAIQDKLVSSLDEKLADTITEWKQDRRKSQITYRQLLSLTSGIAGGPNGNVPSYADSIKQRTFADPGTAFSYGPYPFQIFGEAMKRKLAASNRTVSAYIREKILVPLGMTPGRWTNFATGEPQLPSGSAFVAREWIKFGEFVRLGGVWNNVRLLDQKLLDEVWSRTGVKRTYGMTWWKELASFVGPDDTIAAKGAGKQRLYVIRSHRMVVLRFGEANSWGENAFFEALMPAAFAPFGDGCKGTAGVPKLAALTRPKIGTTFRIELSNLPQNAAGLTLLGVSRTRLGPLPLPLDLGPLGMTGCFLRVSMELQQPWSGSGKVTLGLPIPNDRGLMPSQIFLQSSVLDRPANGFGLTMTNGGAARLGVR